MILVLQEKRFKNVSDFNFFLLGLQKLLRQILENSDINNVLLNKMSDIVAYFPVNY